MTENISTKSSLQETHLAQITYQTVWPNYHFFIGGTVSLHFLELFAHRFSTAHYRNRRDISGAGWPTFFSVVFIPPHKAKRAVWRLARWTGGDRAETLDWLRHSLVDRCLKVRRHQLLIWWCYLIRINSSSCRMHLNPRPSDPTGEKFGHAYSYIWVIYRQITHPQFTQIQIKRVMPKRYG